MAIPWMLVLQNIPWREVITNAPRVADEAKKLWTTLSRQRPVGDVPIDNAKVESPATQIFSGADARDVHLMQSKILSLEAQVADLHTQMLESTKLINVLATQNTALVNHIEKNRTRIKWLTFVLLVVVGAVVFLMWR